MSRPALASRLATRGAAALAAAMLLLAACGQQPEPEPEQTASVTEPTPEQAAEQAPDPEPAPEPAPEVVLPAGEPVRVTIGAIDVDADLVELGLKPNNEMEVPDFGLAGWYTEGPRPGHPGPAVVAAHVDSRAGPDVFYRLRELTVGDTVEVTYDSGDVVTFVVEADPVQTPKDELPGDDIWPVTNERRLTLITCGGSFDRSIGHYRDNIVVYTVPGEPGA